MADINRTTTITLPSDISNEILQKTQEASAVMQMARHINLPGRGLTIPVITGDPTAAWVSETAAKPVSNSTLNTKLMQAYKIAVIETFSKEFVRDAAALYQALVQRLPYSLSAVFDGTVVGAVQAPGNNFDTFASCTAQSILPGQSGTGTYAGLVAADTDIATHGGIMNGIALAPQARGILLAATDSTGRPLFVNSAAEGAIDRVLGAPTYMNKGIYKAPVTSGTAAPAIVGIAGDWTQALYGTVNGVEISVSDTATLTSGQTQINLWQQNMVAVRAEIEVGFRADTSVFNLLTGATS
jgi:HK97 family phage major capsid protein